MANFGLLKLTNVGIQAFAKAQSGEPLKFKRIAMGSGVYTGSIGTLTKLVTENVSVAVSSAYTQNSTCTVEGFFSNEGLGTGFAWREIGLIVEDADGNEILYCYANAGNAYDYIPATTDERYSKYIRIATAIGNATNISIVDNEGLIYVDTQTFNAHKNNKSNPHGVTAAQIGAVPSVRTVNNKQLNEDITLIAEDVGAAPETLTGRIYRVGSSEELDALLNEMVSSTAKDTVKRFEVGFSATIAPLGGGTFMAQLYKVSDKYAFVEMAVYATGYPRIWIRSLFDGVWKDWSYVATIADVTAKMDTVTAKQVGAVINRTDGYTASLNNIVDDAFYRVSPSATDTPVSGQAGVCIHKTWDSNFAVQLFFPAQDKMYRRTKMNGTFTKWALIYDATNKPTPEDIGAAAASSHNIKTYTNLSQIGLADGATMSQVARALPSGSVLRIYVITTANQNLAPVTTNGWLEAHRPSVNHVLFKYTTTSSKQYAACTLNVGDSSELFSGWSKVATDSDLEGLTPADIGAAAASHTQAASTITAGELAGRVMANATSSADLSLSQVRNINAGTADLTPGSSSLGSGCLYLVYE